MPYLDIFLGLLPTFFSFSIVVVDMKNEILSGRKEDEEEEDEDEAPCPIRSIYCRLKVHRIHSSINLLVLLLLLLLFLI